LKVPQFVRQPGALQPRARLFCFPFAGGSVAAFAGWGERLKPDIEVWAAHPRGRGMRFRERPDLHTDAMVGDFLFGMQGMLDLPFAFYGHSLGGLVAFELTRQLQAQGLPMPKHLFVGAKVPPHLGLVHGEIHHLPDEEFVTALQERYAGIPEAVMNEPELLQMFLPALKADFTAYERYQFEENERVDCPLTAFVGESDPGIRPGLMEEWGRHTRGEFTLHTVPGDHFFLTESAELVMDAIRKSLEAGQNVVNPKALAASELR
jgi:surfactin synthase thioesterase subunit